MIVGYMFPAFANANAFSGSGGSTLFGFCLMPVVMLIDAACLAIFGNTPGKALSGIRVETIRHDKLNFSQALRRDGLVYLNGMGLGIPLVSLATYSHNFSRVKNGGQASWDENLSTRVYNVGNNIARTAIVAVIAIAVIGGGRIITQMHEREAYLASQQPSRSVDPSTPSVDPVAVQLANAAADMKPQLVDEITRLDTADAEGRVFTYHFTILRRDATDEQFSEFFRTSIMPKMCSNKDTAELMKDYQVLYRYSYMMPNADHPLIYQIAWADCK